MTRVRTIQKSAAAARCRARERARGPCDYLPSLATPWVSRDTLRFAALRCTTPFWAARMISGSADFKASTAAVLSPEAIASSTLRIVVRMSERRDLLTSVRRAMTRAALRAEEVLAIDVCPWVRGAMNAAAGLKLSKYRRRPLAAGCAGL